MAVSRHVELYVIIAVLAIAAAMIGGALPASAAPVTLTNGGFETGNGTGWNLVIPPGGSVTFPSSGAIDGTYYAKLKTTGPGSYTNIWQDFSVNAEDTISGSARFDANDYQT